MDVGTVLEFKALAIINIELTFCFLGAVERDNLIAHKMPLFSKIII